MADFSGGGGGGGSGEGDALVANPLSQFAATTSLQLKGVISDETGSCALVFATSPALVTPDLGTPSAVVLTNATGTAAGLTAGAATTATSATSATSATTASIATTVTAADEATDTSCFPVFVTAATGNLGAKTNSGLAFNSNTGLLTATAFSGPLTGNVTGNASGTAATVTGAAQAAITSLGTLTTLTVDDITINGNTISSAGASTLAITPTAGQAITFDGTVTLDAGVIAGATSITSTVFVGNLTGDVTGNASGSSGSCTGNAATVTTNANLTGIVTSTGNATAIADKAISYTKLADGTDGNLITWDASGVAALVATGTATHVLTSNGAGTAPTFQAAAGGTPTVRVVNSVPCIGYTNAQKLENNNGGGGTVSATAIGGGISLVPSTGDGARAGFYWDALSNSGLLDYDDNFEIQVFVNIPSVPPSHEATVAIVTNVSNPGANGAAFTSTHVGWIEDVASGAVATLYASNAMASTQTRTDIKADYTHGTSVWLRAIFSGSTNIKFYTNKTLSATHTTNIPTGSVGNFLLNCSVKNDAGETTDWTGTAFGQLNILVDSV